MSAAKWTGHKGMFGRNISWTRITIEIEADPADVLLALAHAEGALQYRRTDRTVQKQEGLAQQDKAAAEIVGRLSRAIAEAAWIEEAA